MEGLAQLSWMDLAIVALLAGGIFIGYTQGMIRYVLNALAVLVAFVLASQLKGPLFEILGFWTAFTPELRELLLFILLFVALMIGGWFAIRAFYRRTRLPIIQQADEVGGALFGLLFVALVLTFHLVVLDSFFEAARETDIATAGPLKGYYDAMNSSLIVQFLRDSLIPTVGSLARPFVPREIATLLSR